MEEITDETLFRQLPTEMQEDLKRQFHEIGIKVPEPTECLYSFNRRYAETITAIENEFIDTGAVLQ